MLKGEVVSGSALFSVDDESMQTKLWHLKLAHLGERNLKELYSQKAFGEDKFQPLEFCEHCVLGKAHRVRFSTGEHKKKGTLDYIHLDLWGPAQTATRGGARYFLSLIDDYSRKLWVYVLKSKDQVFDVFKTWKALVENQTGKRVKRLRTDNGLEFCNREFNGFCAKHGIVRHRTVRSIPQQNGVAERMNRTLLERVRCMLTNAKMSKTFWGEAVVTAAYLINRSPSSAIDFKTPEEKWSGNPPKYDHLRIFGCPAFVHVKEGKLEPRAIKGVFIGYPE